jgi:spore coat polysaccharide biosynthesis protein SpsF
MRTVVIIQARMSSTRLPGKVLLPLGDKTVLGQVIHRVKRCPRLDEIVIATTDAPEDGAIVAEAERNQTAWFRGSLEDVLARYYGAAKASRAEVVVRVTSDCPLFDPELLGQMLDVFRALPQTAREMSYLSNTLKRTYPRGLDAEIFSFAALERAHRQAAKPYEREHVTPYIYEHPELFRLHSHQGPADHSSHRWTLDTPEDYQLLTSIYQALGGNGQFGTGEVLAFLGGHPELACLNAGVRQKTIQS